MQGPAAVKKFRMEEIKHSMDDLQGAITMLCEAGMIEEASILLRSLQELKKTLSRIKVCDDGNVVMVH